MKIRTGFVSNSSSSSFICKACKDEFCYERSCHPKLCEYCLTQLVDKEITFTLEELEELNDYGSLVLAKLVERYLR